MSNIVKPNTTQGLPNGDDCDKKLAARVDLFAEAFLHSDENDYNNLAKCLQDKLLYPFVNTTTIISARYGWDKEQIAFMAGSAFTDAVIQFKKDLEEKKWTNEEATVATYFRKVCRFKFLAIKKNEERRAEKSRKYAINIAAADTSIDDMEQMQASELNYQLLTKAIAQLDEKERQLVTMRHYEGRKPAEIASLLNMEVRHVSDIVYRSMYKLKKIITEMEKQDGNK